MQTIEISVNTKNTKFCFFFGLRYFIAVFINILLLGRSSGFYSGMFGMFGLLDKMYPF